MDELVIYAFFVCLFVVIFTLLGMRLLLFFFFGNSTFVVVVVNCYFCCIIEVYLFLLVLGRLKVYGIGILPQAE